MRARGKWLKKLRVEQGHTLQDVAEAIGRTFGYVWSVERGERGQRIDPITAIKWVQYLGADEDTFFAYTANTEEERHRIRIRTFLQTSAWAHKYAEAQAQILLALPMLSEMMDVIPPGSRAHDLLYKVRDAVMAAHNALHISQKDKPDEPAS